MKTKNDVLMLTACLMMFFNESGWSFYDLLDDDEYYLLVDKIRDVQEDLF